MYSQLDGGLEAAMSHISFNTHLRQTLSVCTHACVSPLENKF